jgi:UDP-N-acetylmuramoyl-tripeptide--D-alanyl-D-alanine ligase
MRQIHRPDGITILDDTYNASPASTVAALELLQGLSGCRVAILGDMLELGQYEHAGHYKVGKVAATAADVLILIGERTKIIAEAAVEHRFSIENVHWFDNSIEAADQISTLVHSGDIVLVKGSNVMRMDRILTALGGGQ